MADRAAAAFAVEPRYPFFDRRLVEFCLALPAEQKIRRGWTRLVMRHAMAGILPEEIRWRGGKSNLAPNFIHGLLTFHGSAMWSYKDHGKSWEAVYEREHAQGFRWVHESFGTNWRMLEVQAAIGRIQLRRLADWTKRRTSNALQIAAACVRYPAVRVPLPAAGFTHAFYRLYAYVRPEALRVGWNRDRIVAEINARGVPCYQGSCSEVYLEKAFDGTSFRPAERLSVARELGETSLMFLVHPTLTNAEIDKTCAVVDEVLEQAST